MSDIFKPGTVLPDLYPIETLIHDEGSRDEAHEVDCHQYAKEYNPTCAYRVDKDYGEKY